MSSSDAAGEKGKVVCGMKRLLKTILLQDRKLVHPASSEAAKRPYLGLDQVESQTGRILAQQPTDYEVGDSTTFAFDDRHILYGKLRPYLNKVALPDFAGRCTTELIPFLPSDSVDRGFAAWILRSPVVLARACAQNNGSRMPRADLDHLLSLEISLPDLPTQRRIAARLKEQMAGVEAARKAVEEQNHGCSLLLSRFTSEVFSDFESGPKMSFGNLIADLRNGLYKHDSFYGSGTLILKMFNIGRFDGSWNMDRVDQLRLTDEEKGTFGLRKGDILINRVNSKELVGKCALCGSHQEGAVFESKNIRLRVDTSKVLPSFACAWLNSDSARSQITERSRQIVGQSTINRSDIESLKIPLPSLEAQKIAVHRIETFRDVHSQMKFLLEDSYRAVSALPAAYLRAAFEGIE
jgi:type I restriction enzyme S subunit